MESMRGFIGWGSGEGGGTNSRSGRVPSWSGTAIKGHLFLSGHKASDSWQGVIDELAGGVWMKGGHQRDALTFSDDLRRNASKATGRIKFKGELLALFSLLLWTGAEPRGGHPTAGGGGTI